MRQLVSVLCQEIEKQIRKHQSNIVRIEGIDNPVIYHNICKKVDALSIVDEFIPKLTKEKYDAFSSLQKAEWLQALTFLHQGFNDYYSEDVTTSYADKSFVDFNNAITKWRNESANYSSTKTTLILLMGTEAAQDTGGLADTSFVISPKEIIASLSKDYSAWFKDVIVKNGIHEEYQKAVHTLYRALFSQINTDIFTLSNFVDSLEDLTFSSVQELVEHICETLNDTWEIPSIINKTAVPKVSILNKGTLSSAKILISAVRFINRADDIPTASSTKKLQEKFKKYAEKNDINIQQPFPEENPLFSDYYEFEKTVIEFMQGVDLDLNRRKILQIDFAIVNSIVNIKLPTIPKVKAPTYSGMPVEAYSKIFLDTIRSFKDSFGVIPTKIKLRVDRVSLSDCTDDRKAESYLNVCNFTGGILGFFNDLTIDVDGQFLEFEYDDTLCEDPFDFNNYDLVSSRIKSTGKWGDPCKIHFAVTATNDNASHNYEFKWVFSPYAPWLNAFSYLADVLYSKGNTYVLPTLVSCLNIQDYLDCESEDEFYAHLQQFRGQALYVEHRAAIRQYFSNQINALFDLVCNDFKNFAAVLTQKGFFNASNELRKLVKSYTELLQAVYEKYELFTDVQKEKIGLIVNLFTISSNSDVVNNCDMGDVLIPAYNPIMLEKIDAQQLFLRRGFKEIVDNMMSGGYTDNVLKSKLEELVQMSSITQASDIIRKKADNYLICKNMWEYYGVYFGKNSGNDLLSSSALGLEIVMDDEDAASMLQNTPKSKIIIRNVMDYVRTFPARVDGLNVAFIAPTDMQHIVAAIHSIVKLLDSEEGSATINIKIISINSKKNSAAYLRRWLDSYFSDEKTVKINTYLHNSTVHSKADVDEFRELLRNYDLCFTYDILQSAGILFDLSADKEIDIDYEKFPMAFIPDTIPATHGKARRVNISQFQFLAAKQHTQTSYKIGYPHSVEGTYRVYRNLELPEIQETILNIAHSNCRWVVCVDQAIDRHMLEIKDSKIIGFTTGEGSYGELNVTVSAHKDILTDIKKMLRHRITEKFSNWDASRLQKAADYCVDDLSQYMDGSRILKALNPYDYEIHSFLAYILTMQMLGLTKQNNSFVVRNLISLDSHKHWFNEDDEINTDNKRPDFVLIEIPLNQDNTTLGTKLKINAKIIECKMGFQNDNHISNAKTQLEKGLRTMSMNWNPNAGGVMHRYWLNQLYRAIIFSPLNMDNTSKEYSIVRDKIYGILNGDFEIEWTGDIYAYWLDLNSEIPDEYEITSSITSELSAKGISMDKIICHNCGQMFIQKMLLPDEERSSSFTFNAIDTGTEDSSEDENTEAVDDTETKAQEDGATIPKAKDIYAPFIRFLSDGREHTRQESLEWYKEYFSISNADQQLVFSSNNHLKFETAFDFVITDFRKNYLIENSTRGSFHITELGRRVYELICGNNEKEFFDVIEQAKKATEAIDIVSNQFVIEKTDITRLDVDCIVNAANTRLSAGGGVCGAIFKEAGYSELQAACDAIGFCETGQVVITPGFSLRSKYIIHAVGPVWNGGYSNEAELLSKCYLNALCVAKENNCHSIAFPLISSGIYGYPKKQAWDIAIKSIHEFLNSNKEYGMLVIMAVLDEDTFNLGMTRLDKFSISENALTEKEDRKTNDQRDEEKEKTEEKEQVIAPNDTLELKDIRVLIGKDKRNIPVYWEFGHPKLANRHILITGISGQGKTYAIQTMILELARQNISSVVFDYTDGFLPGKLEPEFEKELEDNMTQEVAIINRIPVNPFRLQTIEIPPFGSVPEKATTIAGRISDILRHVYSLGDQQAASIYAACKQGIDQYGSNMDFSKLRKLLEDMGTSHSKSVLFKMAQFFDMNLFDSSKEFNWKDVTQSGGKVTVIQLTGLDRELQTVVTEIMMWDAWYSLTKFGNKDTPFVIVFDEAQNLSFKEKSPAEKILREGRKYGWSAWFATQFLKGALDSGEISNLQQAAERLYFKPTGEEMSYIADQIAGNKAESTEWFNTIKGIQKGQCIVQGDRIKSNGQFGATKPSLVNVSSFAERQR